MSKIDASFGDASPGGQSGRRDETCAGPARWQLALAETRLEDANLVRGAGRFIADIRLPRMSYCIFLRSPHAHARIRSCDTANAREANGVLTVLTIEDVNAAGLGGVPWEVRPPGKRFEGIPIGAPEGAPPQPLMADGTVRYVGEIVAAVIAESEVEAQDAVERIIVEYETLDAVEDVDLAEESVQLWPEFAGNRCFTISRGDAEAFEKARRDAAAVVSYSCRNRRLAGAPIEVRGYVGTHDEEIGEYRLYASAGKPNPIGRALAEHVFGVPQDKIVVKVPDVGGGYGTKNVLYPEEALVLFASREVGRPVRWLGTRGESFQSDMAGRDQVDEGEMAFDASGRITAFRARCLSNLGAYLAPRGVVPVRNSGNVMSSVYRVPVMHFEAEGLFSNTAPTCSLRGSGQPEMIYLIERLLDCAASQLGMDRIEIRRRNLISREAMPYVSAFGLTYDSGDPEATLDAAVAQADLDNLLARRCSSESKGLLRGVGIANCIEALVVFYDEPVWLELRDDGSIECLTGTQSSGQGHATAFAQIVAGRLGMDLAEVVLVQGDTARIPVGNGTGASRSISSGGSAAALAVDDLIRRGRGYIARLNEVDDESVTFDNGVWAVEGSNHRYSLADLARIAAYAGELHLLRATGTFSPQDGTFPYGCHVCEVEVDPETGKTVIHKYATAHDVGFAINPPIIEGQAHGSTMHGIGQAVMEAVHYDETGQLINASFMDYAMPRASDAPDFAVDYIEIPSTNNPLGAKGVGESGTLGAPPAVINAILDALAPLGVKDIEMPATSERVWQAIQSAKEMRTAAD